MSEQGAMTAAEFQKWKKKANLPPGRLDAKPVSATYTDTFNEWARRQPGHEDHGKPG
jgi:hypothetical protein